MVKKKQVEQLKIDAKELEYWKVEAQKYKAKIEDLKVHIHRMQPLNALITLAIEIIKKNKDLQEVDDQLKIFDKELK